MSETNKNELFSLPVLQLNNKGTGILLDTWWDKITGFVAAFDLTFAAKSSVSKVSTGGGWLLSDLTRAQVSLLSRNLYTGSLSSSRIWN